MKLKKGDKVQILIGKDRGKIGLIDSVLNKGNMVLVGGLNLYKKHQKPRSDKDRKSGGIISISRPITISKVALICNKCNKPTRIGYVFEGKEKMRVCKKCDSKL